MWENAQAIELWIKNLGKSHSSLVNSNIIPALPLEHLYEDSQSLEVQPCSGIELSFWFETQRFEAIYIYLISQDPERFQPYSGPLPMPFDLLKKQKDVHTTLGSPFKSNGPMLEAETSSFKIGGWDFYELDSSLNPNCQVEFQYDGEMNVYLLSFSVFDKES